MTTVNQINQQQNPTENDISLKDLIRQFEKLRIEIVALNAYTQRMQDSYSDARLGGGCPEASVVTHEDPYVDTPPRGYGRGLTIEEPYDPRLDEFINIPTREEMLEEEREKALEDEEMYAEEQQRDLIDRWSA